MPGALRSVIPFGEVEQLRDARFVLGTEAAALEEVAKRLDSRFCAAVDSILECPTRVIVTGMGKAGLIGQKVAATFSSTGTKSHFLHPAEAVHGDVGCLESTDLLLAFSNSGETEELLRLLPIVRSLNVSTIAVTSLATSTLGSHADITLELGRLREADAWGLAPSTTTTAMLGIGDALALVVSRRRGFTPDQFAIFHPGGSLGLQLRTVDEVMRPLDQVRVAEETSTVREVLTRRLHPGRRSGAVLVMNEHGELAGIFTDSDLARLLEKRMDNSLDHPIGQVMTRKPVTALSGKLLIDVVRLLTDRKISEVPVIDGDNHPLGLIDITDVIGLMPSVVDQ